MNKNHETEVEKYGGIDGYRAEMKRRRAMRQTYQPGGGPGAFTSETSKKALVIRWKGKPGGKTSQSQDTAEDFDRTEEV